MDNFAEWPKHRRVIVAAVDYFRQDDRVPGVLLGGPFASGQPDFFSTLDLYIVVCDRYFAEVLENKDAAATAAGRVLTRLVPDNSTPGAQEVYILLYDGPVYVDFNYLRQSTVKPNWKMRKWVILKDNGNNLADVIRASAELPTPLPSLEMLEAIHSKFWTLCWSAFGRIARGELWDALDVLHCIRTLAIVPLAEWDADRPQEGYRELEARLDDQVLASLADTVSTLNAAALYTSLEAEISLFRTLQIRVWSRYQLPIDQTLGSQIEKAIRKARPNTESLDGATHL